MHGIFVFEEYSVREASVAVALTKMMCVLMFKGGTNVPANGIFTPCVTVIRFYMELHCTSRRSKWHSVIIKRTIVVDIGRYVGDMFDWWRRFKVRMVCRMRASHL